MTASRIRSSRSCGSAAAYPCQGCVFCLGRLQCTQCLSLSLCLVLVFRSIAPLYVCSSSRAVVLQASCPAPRAHARCAKSISSLPCLRLVCVRGLSPPRRITSICARVSDYHTLQQQARHTSCEATAPPLPWALWHRPPSTAASASACPSGWTATSRTSGWWSSRPSTPWRRR